MKAKSIAYTALLCGILCVLSPIAIPAGPVPITLATFAIYIIGAISDIRVSVVSVVLYILIGCIGLPVFSGFSGGFGQIIGPTGGYVVGYIPLIICVGLFNKSKLAHLSSMIIGTLVLYIIGSIWYAIITKCGVLTAVTVCVFPFLAGDIVKIYAALLLTPKIRHILNRY